MTDSTTYISRSPREQDGQNLALLTEQSLTSIQTLAAGSWTDHNTADPGITLLEVLTFVISDLSYRLDFPIRDLMAWPPAQREAAESPFLLAPSILPSNSVTLVDHQRLILDLPEVRAVMLSQNDYRRYDVVLDTNDSSGITTDAERLVLADKIRDRFLSQRNVSDDIASLSFIEKHLLTIRLDLVFCQLDDPITSLTDVFRCLREVISPTTQKRSLESLMDEGYTPDEVLLGPSTENGFSIIDEQGVGAFPKTLYASDLIVSLSQVSTLLSINKLTFVGGSENDASIEDIHWSYDIDLADDEIRAFSLDIESTLSNLAIEIDGQAYILNETQKKAIITALQSSDDGNEDEVTSSVLEDLTSYQQGRYRELKQYYSLQHEFPTIYKLVDERFNGDIDSAELAQVMQLKGFLTLFDQILADQFAQLETLKILLSMPTHKGFYTLAQLFDKMLASESLSDQELVLFWQAVKELPTTYLSQPITDISGMENLLGDYWSSYKESGFQPLSELPFNTRQLDRLNRSMGHLLARYAETTLDANLLQYEKVFTFYSSSLKSKLLTGIDDEDMILKGIVQLKQVVDKATLLTDYETLSRFRAGGFHYLNSEPKNNSSSYLSHRILRFLGINDTQMIPLSTSNREGIHLVEGSLLWAGNEDIRADSIRTLYFVLPDWPTRFAYDGFRALLEEVIVKETPMHLAVNITYLGRQSMNDFEQLYYAWLNAMTQCPFPVFLGSSQINAEDSDSEEWLTPLSTLLRDFLTDPTSVITSSLYNSLISQAAIRSEDPNVAEFRVHYQPLDFLKTSSAISRAFINPEDPTNKEVFNISIQSPNTIEELQ